jgi:CopG family transcriptional regulator/antitoxin EndoAI
VGDLRRIMISLPDSLLEEVDGMVALEHTNRSELIRQAMRQYISARRRRELRDQMKQGYLAMATLNLALAEEGFACEQESQLLQGRK